MITQPELHLMLFVVGSDKHLDVISELRKALLENYGDAGYLEVIDVLSMPDKAMENNVFATPMLVRSIPQPLLKMLVNISSAQDAFMAIVNHQTNHNILV